MITRTAEEAKANYIDKMGEPLGTQFAELLQEVGSLYVGLGEFTELFRDEARVKVLNQAAPAIMFRIILVALWQSILLSIARLTDPPKSAGKKNLTIQNLPELVNPEVRADVQKLVDAALEKSEFCRDHRNRQLAHLDLDLRTNQSTEPLKFEPLESATKKAVDEALDGIGSVLKQVHLHYIGELVFSRNAGGGGG
jgi:hypothetical protein